MIKAAISLANLDLPPKYLIHVGTVHQSVFESYLHSHTGDEIDEVFLHTMMDTFKNWINAELLNEANTRYSVEVNFRTKLKEVMEGYARICLGYVSAALKQNGFHVKQVFDDGLIRILVSSRNWDDGEWVVVVSWNPHHNFFFITKGFYNKMNKQVSFKSGSEVRCKSDNASEITSQVKSLMHHLKDVPDRHIEKMKRVPLKRGPKS